MVKILKSPKEISKIKSGDVLVAEMTSPDYVPAMKKAVAIVTDQGGATSHAAIVSRELGIPCVVGTKVGTQILKNGMDIELNFTNVVKPPKEFFLPQQEQILIFEKKKAGSLGRVICSERIVPSLPIIFPFIDFSSLQTESKELLLR